MYPSEVCVSTRMNDTCRKILYFGRDEVTPPWRRLVADLLVRAVPSGMGYRTRSALYRLAGMYIGRSTILAGPLQFDAAGIPSRVRIGAHCFLNSEIFLDTAASICIGDHVAIGHHTIVITTSHRIGGAQCRADLRKTAPVIIEDGAWIGARVTLLPGVRVGAGAVVASGAVVTRDVLPNTLVGGVPARVIRDLDP